MVFHSNLNFPALLLSLSSLMACGPKDAFDDAGDESGGASTTTGDEATTSGASDPTTPGTATAATGGTATTATGTATATTASTSATSGEEPSTTTGPGTTVGTSASDVTTDGTSETGDEPAPVIPCEGEGTPLELFPTTMAYLQSQVPPAPNPSGTSGTTDGGELDPGTLMVKLSNQTFTCADPEATLPCGKLWEVTIVIPPEFQSPGVFNLVGNDVRGVAIETGAGQGEDCSFGGGSFDATFQILAIDDKTVQGRLCNVAHSFFESDPDLEGTFTAARCQ